MPEEASDIQCHFLSMHIHVDEAVLGVTQPAIEEVLVAGKERRPAQLTKEGNNLHILHAGTANIEPDLANTNATLNEHFALVGRYVLVEHVHAEVGSSMNSLACLSKAWLANWTAS